MKQTFEYDTDKSRRNLDAHGLDFESAQELWDVDHVIVRAKKVGMEDRQAIIGLLSGKMYVAIFAKRVSLIRIISCHRADKRLQRVYERIKHEKKESEAH